MPDATFLLTVAALLAMAFLLAAAVLLLPTAALREHLDESSHALGRDFAPHRSGSPCPPRTVEVTPDGSDAVRSHPLSSVGGAGVPAEASGARPEPSEAGR